MHRALDTAGPLLLADLDPADVRSGTPRAGHRVLDDLAGVEVGVWEMTPGTAVDVEVDEVFVVIAGRARVRFDDGEEIALVPGVTVRLRAGERTVWTVEETLRKVYVCA